jgi:hypothetical protein
MAKSDAELMRDLMLMIREHSQGVAQDHQLEEDITKFRRTTQWLKGLFSRKARGVSDVLRGAMPLLKQFERYLGRRRQDYDTVTWQTVLLFLQSSATRNIPIGRQRGVPLNLAQVGEILDDMSFRRAIRTQLQKEQLIPGGLSNLDQWVPKSHRLPSMRSALVGSQIEQDRARRSEVIIHNLLEMAVSMMFDLVDAENTDATSSATGAGASPATGVTATSGGGAPAPVPTPASAGSAAGGGAPPTLTQTQLNALGQILQTLKGSSP